LGWGDSTLSQAGQPAIAELTTTRRYFCFQ